MYNGTEKGMVLQVLYKGVTTLVFYMRVYYFAILSHRMNL